MARKVSTFVATSGRDAGKHFRIEEMPAMQAEKWAMRALLAVGRAGVELPDDIASGGMAAIAAMGIRAITSVSFDEAEPLLDEMMRCASIVPDPAKPIIYRPIDAEDIEEIATVVQLRDEVVNLHVGFSIAAELSKFGAAARAKLGSNPTETSPEA